MGALLFPLRVIPPLPLQGSLWIRPEGSSAIGMWEDPIISHHHCSFRTLRLRVQAISLFGTITPFSKQFLKKLIAFTIFVGACRPLRGGVPRFTPRSSTPTASSRPRPAILPRRVGYRRSPADSVLSLPQALARLAASTSRRETASVSLSARGNLPSDISPSSTVHPGDGSYRPGTANSNPSSKPSAVLLAFDSDSSDSSSPDVCLSLRNETSKYQC